MPLPHHHQTADPENVDKINGLSNGLFYDGSNQDEFIQQQFAMASARHTFDVVAHKRKSNF